MTEALITYKMPVFLRLHDPARDGAIVIVNTEEVLDISSVLGLSKSYIRMKNGFERYVKETPDEIWKIMKE
jgi:hypothetical protein